MKAMLIPKYPQIKFKLGSMMLKILFFRDNQTRFSLKIEI